MSKKHKKHYKNDMKRNYPTSNEAEVNKGLKKNRLSKEVKSFICDPDFRIMIEDPDCICQLFDTNDGDKNVGNYMFLKILGTDLVSNEYKFTLLRNTWKHFGVGHNTRESDGKFATAISTFRYYCIHYTYYYGEECAMPLLPYNILEHLKLYGKAYHDEDLKKQAERKAKLDARTPEQVERESIVWHLKQVLNTLKKTTYTDYLHLVTVPSNPNDDKYNYDKIYEREVPMLKKSVWVIENIKTLKVEYKLDKILHNAGYDDLNKFANDATDVVFALKKEIQNFENAKNSGRRRYWW